MSTESPIQDFEHERHAHMVASTPESNYSMWLARNILFVTVDLLVVVLIAFSDIPGAAKVIVLGLGIAITAATVYLARMELRARREGSQESTEV